MVGLGVCVCVCLHAVIQNINHFNCIYLRHLAVALEFLLWYVCSVWEIP